MTGQYFLLTLFTLTGTLALSAAVLDMDWFLNSENVRPIVKYMGRKGARIFYGFIGLLLIAAGLSTLL